MRYFIRCTPSSEAKFREINKKLGKEMIKKGA
jgi:hypothetical protein